MENPDGPMEIPDQLKKPVPTGQGGSGALRDFLFDAASWDPVAEQVILDVCREGTEAEPAMAGQRLLAEQVLTEPSMVYELVRLLAQADALDPADLRPPPGSPGGIPADRLDDPPGPTIPTIGRETESSRGTRLATRQRDGVSIVCITGPAGIGKTRLAREITKAIGGQEPARRLEVSLSLAAPWTAGRQLITAPADALLDLLTQLGVRADDAPATLDGRRARYLEELAGQRPAIVIDGAIDESQVLPLLPPTHGSVVVTSRSPLTGPSNLRAEYLQLGPLTRASSRQLVQRIFAALAAEPEESVVAAVYDWCGGVPEPTILVCRWIVARARAEGLTVETFTERIRAAHPGGPIATAILSLLADDQQAVVRVLGLLQLPAADLATVSLGTGLSQDRARAALDQLTDMGLASGTAGAWALVPLTASWSRALSWGQPPEPGVESMLGPVLDLYYRRAAGLRDVMAASSGSTLATLRAWAGERWRAGQADRTVVLSAAADCPRPSLGRRLAAVVMDVAAIAEGHQGGWGEIEASIAAVADIARDAGDHQLEGQSLNWLRNHGLTVSGPGIPDVDVPRPETTARGLSWLESIASSEIPAPTGTPVIFGAGRYRA